jgi:nitrite reductase/ring-hydroxylating ferredoxin subunit
VSRLVRVGSPRDIPVGRGQAVVVDGRELAVFNAGDGLFHAVSGSCPHEGGPLAEGLLDRGHVICPWHAFDFDPRTGVCKVDPELAIDVFPVRAEGDDLLVELP